MAKHQGNYYHQVMTTPVGEILLIKNEDALVRISLFQEEHLSAITYYQSKVRPEHFEEELRQLEDYFAGKQHRFDLKLAYDGTPFQKKVWMALSQIPYGQTRSYKAIAEMIDNPKAVRGVGQANRNNPLPLVIPCHRVIASSGKLIGFGGSHIDIQKQLLALEKGELQHA